jgi:hypothetical protein
MSAAAWRPDVSRLQRGTCRFTVMLTFRDSTQIAADRARIWRALTIPSEVIQWDTGVVAPLDAPPEYPSAGQRVRWRYRLGPIALVLHDEPLEVLPEETFRSSIRLGPFHFDETYSIASQAAGRSELTVELSVASAVPLVGALLVRLAGYPLARATVRTSLRSIKRHCEAIP